MSTSQFRNRPHFSAEFGITTYTFRYARLAPTDLVFFWRTAIISRTGNHRTTPIPAAIAIATGIGPTIVPTARLRRLRITRLRRLRVTGLCRCRVRLCRSRSSRLRIAGLYRRGGSGRRNRRNRCRISRRHGSSTVAGTAAFISLVAGRDLLRLFDSHFVVGALLTSSRRDGCIPRGNSSYLPIGINGSDLLVA